MMKPAETIPQGVRPPVETRSVMSGMLLPELKRQALQLSLTITYRNLDAGELLYHRGDRASAMFFVEKGRLHLVAYTSEGRLVPLYVVRPGECVAEAALFADSYCGDVVAEVDSRVAVFPKEEFVRALHQNLTLSDEFMARLTRRFNWLRVRLELRNLQSARERILQYLEITVPSGQNTVWIDRPLKSIADDLGLTHESFYRTLALLVKEGILTRRKGLIGFEKIAQHDRDHTAFCKEGISISSG